jgi:transcription-repair coupling factor (superfamily II helicase)
MKIQDINCLYGASPQAGALLKILENKSVNRVFLQGLLASSVPMLFASVASRLKQTFLFVLSDADEGGYFYHDLVQLMGQETVFYFPSSYRRAVKYGQRDAANEILRTEVLSKIDFGKCLYIVTSPDALSELVVSKSSLDNRLLKLKTGQNIDITDVEKTLREFGFEEVDYVYEPGQFAVRGSILDVFSFSCEYPFRIDFFGDEIDTIRTFEVQDQLSQDKRIEIEIVPELAAMKENKVPFLDFLPDDTVLVMKDFAYVRDSIDKIYREGFSRQAMTEQLEGVTEVEKAKILLNLQKERNLCTGSQFSEETARFKWVEFGPQPNSVISVYDKEAILKFNITPQPLFHKNFDLLKHSLEDYLLQGYKLYILADSQKQQQRLRDIFDEMGADRERSGYDSQRSGIQFTSVDKTLHEGFADNDLKLCFFTDHQIFDRFHKYSLRSDSARAGKMALTMKELQEMDPGDYIVHIDFGIGKFGGLVRVPTPDGGYQEVIRIIYQNNDKVDVSIHSLYKISKYRRQDTGEPPRLSTLGTGAWDRLKERTKAKIKDIARDLIRLYAKRRHEKGFPYSTDSYMQHELEASFLYEDTPDQLKATQDVKADMEMAKPMDRLVCGDVGFGKTEVAVRAAFKAACDSKQVAVLVPTTVLAFQHYQTFRDRLKDFPVRVDYLTRARSAKQTRQILDDLASGKIDIIIGTHKLLGKQLKWHDLGLLIIDEEQKFGVSTKEKLRKLKTNVDTLTMSATPIPRTLQFSLMGARDMSIIRTPPPNRYPIQTELTTYGHEVIADAINFEMSRNGQVFFVNNRISNLPEIEQLIHKYVPDCRVVIGHGQMEPEELEKRIMGFINYDYDVLLSTTIVENGIDIPNANTIIINDAHRFGLSDLHQMRGRVGRSNRKAFCYLLAPPKSVLTPEARRRLEALENFSELGSGFNLAMQDLDIRGAGNLLGAEQSGFMEDLGYETYQKILSQAVTELKNDEFQDIYADEIAHGRQVNGDEFVEDCAIESDLEMYFPDTYVPGSSERMLLYRELDNINDDAALEAYRKRLIDRFGPVPREGEELMQVVSLRRLGKSLGCEKILLRQSRMTLQFVSNSESAYYQSQAFGKVLDYLAANPRRCNLTEIKGRRLMRMADVKTVEEAVEILKAIKA